MMKDAFKFWILASALVFFACFPASSPAVTLSGPERAAEVGHMQKWKSDTQGTWMIFPPNAVEVESDSDAMTVYFVPLREGTLYPTFFYIQDGTIRHEQLTVPIGAAPDPTPDPSPAPSPSPAVKLTDREKAAAASALHAVIDGVTARTIRTPAGARSTFKQTLNAKGQICDGRRCYLPEALQKATDDWSARTDFSSAETVKASFEGFLPEVE